MAPTASINDGEIRIGAFGARAGVWARRQAVNNRNRGIRISNPTITVPCFVSMNYVGEGNDFVFAE